MVVTREESLAAEVAAVTQAELGEVSVVPFRNGERGVHVGVEGVTVPADWSMLVDKAGKFVAATRLGTKCVASRARSRASRSEASDAAGAGFAT